MLSTNEQPSIRCGLLSGPALVSYLALGKLLLHFATNGQYGYHGDEFYFIACGEYLDCGYVDHAPLIAVVAKLSRLLLGDSLFAIRFLPALAGAFTVVLAGRLTREMGGTRFAQCLAALVVIIAPVYLYAGNMLCIAAFEPLFWTSASYLVVLVLRYNRPRLWLAVGLVCGLGLLNKHSMLLWGFGLVVGLLLTSARRQLGSRWLWLGGLVALIVFAPNLAWQIQHDWPTLRFIQHINEHVMSRITVIEFALGQLFYEHPISFPIWISGLGSLLICRRLRTFRLFGWAYLALFVLLNLIKSKIYYLAPVYPVLFAAGAVTIDGFIAQKQWRHVRPILAGALVVGGVLTLPLGLPVLSIKQSQRYVQTLTGGLLNKIDEVNNEYYAVCGWGNQVETVARVYAALPPDDQAKCSIWAGNYAEAGAIDFLGRRYGLPGAISGHNSYHMWGPGDASGEVMIVFGVWDGWREEFFEDVTLVATIRSEMSIPSEANVPVYVCRKPKMPISEFWPRVKTY
ncbi:MAG: glycosyltransferase family 39 protein [Phycisphaerales bacterium]|nr:MAG: glycosyltransferase family 39 protein [Phycisphaerales bacterium]